MAMQSAIFKKCIFITQLETKAQIEELVKKFVAEKHSKFNLSGNSEWKPGDHIPYSGRVFDSEEVLAATNSALDFWLTLGAEGHAFEKEFADYLGVSKTILCNSGSSANLLAISALTSSFLDKDKRINKGDEVITVATGFPTTVNPIIQVGAIPVFVDADANTGNINSALLEKALSPGKTKAVFVAHALGNPFNLFAILSFCRKNNLWLIEDNCDALGCTYKMPRDLAESLGFKHNSPGIEQDNNFVERWTGTWGHLSTQSFYPPHHITMGEGGAINVNYPGLHRLVESFRDWGRDCWCPSGVDNTCKKRFDWQLGDLPAGYDHKFTYSHIGFNLKPLDLQAAIGRAQLKKLPVFIEARKHNWTLLRSKLDQCSKYFEFALPENAISWSKDTNFQWDDSELRQECSWFGFMLRLKNDVPFTRKELADELDNKNIGHRMMFAGNLLRQPAYKSLLDSEPGAIRVASDLTNSDLIMNNVLFIGVYPGLTESMIDFVANTIISFVKSKDQTSL